MRYDIDGLMDLCGLKIGASERKGGKWVVGKRAKIHSG